MQDIVWKRTLDALDWLLIANFKLVALKMKWFMPDHFSQARLKLHPHLLPFDSVCKVEYHPISKLLDSRQTSVALLLLSRTLPTAAALRADFNGCQWTFQKAFKSSYGFPRSALQLLLYSGLGSLYIDERGYFKTSYKNMMILKSESICHLIRSLTSWLEKQTHF